MFHRLNTNPTYLSNGSVMSTQIWHELIKPKPITCKFSVKLGLWVVSNFVTPIEHKIHLLSKIHLLRGLVLTWKIFLRIMSYEKIPHFIILTIKMKWEILLEVIINHFNMILNDPLENILRAVIVACLVYN